MSESHDKLKALRRRLEAKAADNLRRELRENLRADEVARRTIRDVEREMDADTAAVAEHLDRLKARQHPDTRSAHEDTRQRARAADEAAVGERVPEDPLWLKEAEAKALKGFLRTPWPTCADHPERYDLGPEREVADRRVRAERTVRDDAQIRQVELKHELTQLYQARASARGRSHPRYASRLNIVTRAVRAHAHRSAHIARMSRGSCMAASRWPPGRSHAERKSSWCSLIQCVDAAIPEAERDVVLDVIGMPLETWTRWRFGSTAPPPENQERWAAQIGDTIERLVREEKSRRRRR